MPKAYSPILTSSKLLRVRKKKVRNHQATLVMINQIAMPPSVSLAIDEHGGHDGMEWNGRSGIMQMVTPDTTTGTVLIS